MFLYGFFSLPHSRCASPLCKLPLILMTSWGCTPAFQLEIDPSFSVLSHRPARARAHAHAFAEILRNSLSVLTSSLNPPLLVRHRYWWRLGKVLSVSSHISSNSPVSNFHGGPGLSTPVGLRSEIPWPLTLPHYVWAPGPHASIPTQSFCSAMLFKKPLDWFNYSWRQPVSGNWIWLEPHQTGEHYYFFLYGME